VRLFVAVRPPLDVVDALGALPRPAIDGVRWTTRDQWHVTLRFFGDVDDADDIIDAMRLAPLENATARMGPHASMLGRGVVQLPVAGLDELAAGVVDATRSFGDAPPSRPFHGHLTLARTKARGVHQRALELECAWPVRDVELIRSHLGRGGAHYETISRFALRRV